ncbi:MAG: preprotein translocase subunit SecG [Paludibacteraceae bacterium]
MNALLITLTVLIVLSAVILTLIVLVQNSKGGGLAAGFQSSNQIMGVRKTTDVLEKATWGLAAFMLIMSIIVVGVQSNSRQTTNDSEIIEQSMDIQNQMQKGMAAPNFGETPSQEQQPAAQPEKK